MWNRHHHYHVVPLARTSLTLSRHFSLSFITSGRSSGLHPVFSQSCCMYFRAGRPAFAWPYARVHRSTWLMSSSLLKLHHHHHAVPPARISLTLSRHFSLSFIASGRSSGLHPVSSHSCCMYVRAGRPAFSWPYAGVYWSTSLMSSSLLLQQCPACLVRLTCIVFVMGGRWP